MFESLTLVFTDDFFQKLNTCYFKFTSLEESFIKIFFVPFSFLELNLGDAGRETTAPERVRSKTGCRAKV